MANSIKESIKNKLPFSPNSNGIDEVDSNRLRTASKKEVDAFLDIFETSYEGLAEEQVDEKLIRFGKNEVHHEKAPSWFSQLITAFINPFIGILAIIAVISFLLDVWLAKPGQADYKTVLTVGIMVLVSSLLRFFQEFRSNQAAEQLKSMVKTTATVLRKEIGKKEKDIKNLHGGQNKETILLTVNTFKKFCLKAGTSKADEVHDYYIKLEELLNETINDESNELRRQLEYQTKHYLCEMDKMKKKIEKKKKVKYELSNSLYIISNPGFKGYFKK